MLNLPGKLLGFNRGADSKSASASNQMKMRASRLADEAVDDLGVCLSALKTTPEGLTESEAEERLRTHGLNEVARELPPPWYLQFLGAFKNPFIIVLIVLSAVSLATDPSDLTGPAIIGVMIAVSVGIRFWQEFRSTVAAEKLRAMVSTRATVYRRNGEAEDRPQKKEVPIRELVPGDIVALAAGDMVPADVRLITSKNLFVSQAALTGESMPVEKADLTAGDSGNGVPPNINPAAGITGLTNLCFMGTNVISGTAMAVVMATGKETYFGSLAKGILGDRPMTSFDRGVSKVTWLLIRFMLVMVPVVLVINGFTKGDWKEAFFFALSVAVGLTPEMLPLIVTANLARGAIDMSRKKVIVKRLNAIQNFGAMDTLCTDKTGTLTQDRVALLRYVDIQSNRSKETLWLAYLNSFHQTGLKNLLDHAVLAYGAEHPDEIGPAAAKKIDELPFDFMRRRMSVVVETGAGAHLLICKGAVDDILNVCSRIRIKNDKGTITQEQRELASASIRDMNEEGLRVVAVAFKEVPPTKHAYLVEDEAGLTLTGFLGFLDPPKESAAQAIKALRHKGVDIKVLTGDSAIVTRKVCKAVGLEVGEVTLGHEIDDLSDEALANVAERTTVFAQFNPLQKARVVRALKQQGHTVGFMGDGINDAPGLRAADVGISVDTGVDIAKESADIILLEKSLLVLEAGVVEGRVIFGNIIKYIKMTASSNFGNVFSVLTASILLPFLPMLALQLLVQNLLYDFSQLSIPWDRMDEDFLDKPRKWDTSGLARFMIFIGPVSSVFDFATFGVMWFVFKANAEAHQALFQSGWFIEGLLSQTLIVHLIRTERIPFFQSRAALPVLLLTGLVMAVGIAIPFSPLSDGLKMQHLPLRYFPWLVGILFSYFVLALAIKSWYIRRFQAWL